MTSSDWSEEGLLDPDQNYGVAYAHEVGPEVIIEREYGDETVEIKANIVTSAVNSPSRTTYSWRLKWDHGQKPGKRGFDTRTAALIDAMIEYGYIEAELLIKVELPETEGE